MYACSYVHRYRKICFSKKITMNAGTTAEGKRKRHFIYDNAGVEFVWNVSLYACINLPQHIAMRWGHSFRYLVWKRHQLPMQLYGFSCHPEKHSQEEVVHECRDHSTEYRNSSWECADDEGDVQPQQNKAEIQQQLHMDSIPEFPEWCMWGVVRWLGSTNVLPCVVMRRISSILPNSYM